MFKALSWLLAVVFCLAPVLPALSTRAEGTSPYIVVLGIAQDGGVPQAGSSEEPGWTDPSRRCLVACLGLIDGERRWLFDCTPDFPEQLQRLDTLVPVAERPGLAGVFLTHAHMGHYTGLMYLGHEVMGAKDVPVYAMPRMKRYLEENGPWSQLVNYHNIALHEMKAGEAVDLNERLRVRPFLVPHRQEYSEVVGFIIDGPSRDVLFIPDIDSWEEWDAQGTRIEDVLARVDLAFVDATFMDGHEIPGRDMSGFPHPFIRHTMKRLADLPASERAKIRFIHLNHTNPALFDEDVRAEIRAKGFGLAEAMERVDL